MSVKYQSCSSRLFDDRLDIGLSKDAANETRQGAFQTPVCVRILTTSEAHPHRGRLHTFQVRHRPDQTILKLKRNSDFPRAREARSDTNLGNLSRRTSFQEAFQHRLRQLLQ